MNSLLVYLLEVTGCHLTFYFLYIGLFRSLSFYQVNRVYLLSSTLFSFIIPILNIPVEVAENADFMVRNGWTFMANPESRSAPGHYTAGEGMNISEMLLTLLFIAYLSGCAIYLWKLLAGVSKILKLIKKHEVRHYQGLKVIHLDSGPSFFAFWNYVFINTRNCRMTSEELQQVFDHEKSHVYQRHTLDNLFMELTGCVCWFNPFIRKIKQELNQVHEFYADREAIKRTGNLEHYSKLILRLSCGKPETYLTHQFSMSNIKKRIIMLNEIKNQRRYKVRYLFIIPGLSLLMALFSFTGQAPLTRAGGENVSGLIIGEISWSGNTLYSDEYLTGFMRLERGDHFNEEAINELIYYRPNGKDLASLFMDKGYLFFTVEMRKEVNQNTIDLNFEIFEGEITEVDKIIVTGNKEVSTQKILDMIAIKKGELFNRSKLVMAQQKIIDSGLFDPEKVIPFPIPHQSGEKSFVDLEFKVTEL